MVLIILNPYYRITVIVFYYFNFMKILLVKFIFNLKMKRTWWKVINDSFIIGILSIYENSLKNNITKFEYRSGELEKFIDNLYDIALLSYYNLKCLDIQNHLKVIYLKLKMR